MGDIRRAADAVLPRFALVSVVGEPGFKSYVNT